MSAHNRNTCVWFCRDAAATPLLRAIAREVCALQPGNEQSFN